MSWYLVTQSISRAIRSRLPVSIALSARSHMSRTLLLTGSAPVRSVKSLARFRYSYWISSALSSRPFASRIRLRPVMSWLTSRMARMALSRVRSRMIAPASIIRSTRSVDPTLSKVVVSLMLESPTITCRRRNRSASACGSSRVLMIGRDRVVADDTPSQMCSARWLTQYTAPRGVCSTFARTADDLPGDQERDQDVGQPAELAVPADQVVLMAAVGVARRVRVVLEQVDVTGDALFTQPGRGRPAAPRGSARPPCRAPPSP